MNGELPKGWVWSRVGELFETTTGNTPPKEDPSNYGEFIPFVKPPELKNSLISKAEDGLSEKGSKLARILPPYSLLVSCIGILGKVGMNVVPVAFNQQINAILFPKHTNPKYGFYYFQSTYPKEVLYSLASATTVHIVNKSKFKTVPIPLPPLAEQQRIVNKIEELFTNLDKGIEALEQVKYKLKVYRQAILKYAMEGKLTAKWREEKNYPSVSVQFNLNSDDYYFSKEIANKNIHSSWKLLKVEEIADFFKGQRSPKNYYVDKSHPEAKPYIRIQDFKTKKVSMYTRADWCLQCQKTDTLLATDGAIGSSDYGWEGVLTHHILCIRPKTEFVNPYYLFLFINLNKNFFYENRTGVCSPTLRQQYVKNLAMPLPPLEEQNIIVERIEQLFSLADYIEETVDSKLEQSKTLRQSILKKAFEGKLVPQDPNDEPAENILEKIKKQRLNKEKLVQEKLV